MEGCNSLLIKFDTANFGTIGKKKLHCNYMELQRSYMELRDLCYFVVINAYSSCK